MSEVRGNSQYDVVRLVTIPLVVGAVVTSLIAWACALWVPMDLETDPWTNPHTATNTFAPDGTEGVYYCENGVGTTYMCLAGTLYWHNGKPDLIYVGPYGG